MSQNPATLGFYSLGIPVIFVRSDVLARLDDGIWNYPITHQDPSDLRQLKDVATLYHEIRHFHDALLTPFLFERFLIEIQRNYIGGIILTQLQQRGAEVASADGLDSQSAGMLAFHNGTLESYRAKYNAFFHSQVIDALDLDVNYHDLLETNALITELCVVNGVSGWAGLERYWRYWKPKLASRYTLLIDAFSRRSGSFFDRMDILQRAIIAALYCGNSPVREFDRLTRHGILFTAKHADQIAPADAISELMRNNISSEMPMIMGIDISIGTTSTEVRQISERVSEYFIRPSELEEARQTLLKRYGSLNFDRQSYVQHLGEVAIPPTCFYADEEMLIANVIPFVRKEDLRRLYGDAYTICERRDSSRRTSIAFGIVPTRGFGSFIKINKVDTMLSIRYMSQGIFQDKVTYCQGMDETYRRLLQGNLGLRLPT